MLYLCIFTLLRKHRMCARQSLFVDDKDHIMYFKQKILNTRNLVMGKILEGLVKQALGWAFVGLSHF